MVLALIDYCGRTGLGCLYSPDAWQVLLVNAKLYLEQFVSSSAEQLPCYPAGCESLNLCMQFLPAVWLHDVRIKMLHVMSVPLNVVCMLQTHLYHTEPGFW